MSTNFFFKKFTIEDFRVFRNISFDKIKRINIISGINGSGKSSLIETMFLSIDLNSPTCLVRPFQWRGIPLSGDDLKILFPSDSMKGKVSAKTLSGDYFIDLSYGPPARDMIMSASRNLDPTARNAYSQLSAPNAEGVSILAKKGNIAAEPSRWFMSQNGDNINATGIGLDNQIGVAGVYLSQFAPLPPREMAEYVSKLMKQGQKGKIIEYMKMLSPGVKDLAVFQDGQVAQTYVALGDDKFTPLALMGGGFKALAEMVVSVMVSRNGIVFIDELDSALHFSVIPKLWGVLAEIANLENVQIFAITHSRKTIASAATGIKDSGRSSDFQYVRIDDMDTHHRCVHYNIDEIQDAIELHVEVR